MNGNTTASSHIRAFAPARLLVDLNFAAKIWFGLFLFMAICEAATLVVLLRPARAEGQRVLFVAGNGQAYGGDMVKLATLTNLHVRVAEDVTQALFNRNPAGFDQPDRIPLLFLPEAARQAEADCEEQSSEREARQLRQKPEITRLQYLEVSDERILFTVRGQLVQAGVFNGQALVNALPFQLNMALVPNPNLMLQAAFPLVVSRYHYEIHPR